MTKVIICGILLAGVAIVADKALEIPTARLTLRALDEEENPVSDAHVRMTFEEAFNWSGSSSKIVPVSGVTNDEGKFTGEGHSFDTQGGQLQKASYYMSSPESYNFKKAIAGKWQPWNPTLDVVMRKIINPIAMYAKYLNIGIPKIGETLGFDLEAGDWVAPYGRGKLADILFTAKLDRRAEYDFDYELKIAFPQKGDGLQTFKPERDSVFKSPRTAPLEGYQSEWLQKRSAKQGTAEISNIDEKKNYFFRVRTVLNAEGKVISANYGKIYGDFMNFTYYLNPKKMIVIWNSIRTKTCWEI